MYVSRKSIKRLLIGCMPVFLEGFINIKINTKENPKSKFEQDEYILKVTVGNEAACGCKLYLCMVKLLRACGHFLS